MRTFSALALISVLTLAGCKMGTISDEQNRAAGEEYSQKSYEKAMRDAGRGDEYDAEMKKWKESQQGQDSGFEGQEGQGGEQGQ